MNLQYKYFPLLKTTDAELKGYEKLPDIVKDGILPIFELTKSRRSKYNEDAKLDKKLIQLATIIGKRPFILDLTANDTELSNQELAEMLNNTSNGHEKWRIFAEDLKKQGFNLIPVVHYNENNPNESVEEARKLEKSFDQIAFRADARDEDMMAYLEPILNGLKNSDNLILILDVGFVQKQAVMEKNALLIKDKIDQILKLNKKPGAYVPIASSFPKSVASYGDMKGVIPLLEVSLSEKLIEALKPDKISIFYGDYASVHPDRYPGGGGGWIPRIDFPLEKSCYFYRHRVEIKELTKNAYVKAARNVISDTEYTVFQNLDVWGIQEIFMASLGEPNGKSPSYWIAVRICLHITRQYLRTNRPAWLSSLSFV